VAHSPDYPVSGTLPHLRHGRPYAHNSLDPRILKFVKLADQLSQIFGDLSVSEDALKLVLNGEASLDERKEALRGFGGDAIRGASRKT
jgi:hypothetical protein